MPKKRTRSSRLRLHEGKFSFAKGTCRASKGKRLLKKSGGILCEGNRLEAYRFIKQYHDLYGTRWLLKRMGIAPNAYYHFLKDQKAEYIKRKNKIKTEIRRIYHEHKGTPGYRSMRVYLKRKGISLSNLTVHKYMNTELHLFSITRKRKPDYVKGSPHKVFDNKLNQDFTADAINQKWCTDFTYLSLSNGSKRYNCSIIDLHERSLIASITDKHMTSDLAIRTLQKALKAQANIKPGTLILHSDQGRQYTSKDFTEFCKKSGIVQSMSKAGHPYDNAPMERYFNTLKSELIYLHNYHTDEELSIAIEDFAYVQYNHVRPHSYNNYKTPFEARYQE